MARIGVGHSGGCRTCLRRKVKCDERRPTCERCVKGNRNCEGYTRDHRFVDENSRIERHVKKKTVNSKASNDPPKIRLSASLALARSPNSESSIATTIGLSGFEDDIHISFLLANIFSGMARTPWLELHALDPSPCSQMSLRALAAVYFGRIHRLDESTGRGFELYGKALLRLNHNLHDSELACSISVLKSAITLELYEFIAFNSASGWLKHAGGVGRLIELRGPRRHQALAERQLLEGNRVTIALECLIEKKRCFLEHQDWKIIPWATDPWSNKRHVK